MSGIYKWSHSTAEESVWLCFQLPEQQANQKVLVSAKIRQPYYTALSQHICISSTDQREYSQHNISFRTNLHSRILETFTATWWASTTVPITVLSFTRCSSFYLRLLLKWLVRPKQYEHRPTAGSAKDVPWPRRTRSQQIWSKQDERGRSSAVLLQRRS